MQDNKENPASTSTGTYGSVGHHSGVGTRSVQRRVAFAIGCLIVSVHSAPLKAEGAVSPSEIELAIQPTWTDDARFEVNLPPSAPKYGPLDIVFVFDATQSMTNVIGEFQRSVDRILGDISNKTANVRYAVAEFGDYSGMVAGCDPAPGLPVWRLVTDFTANAATAKSAVSQVSVKWNGCDQQEAYLRALDEVRQLDWREDATRYVVLLGDAPTRSPDPGRDGRSNTGDDLRTSSVTSAFDRDGITILGIYIGPEDGEVADDFATLADSTPNGMALSLSGGRKVADLIEQGLTKIPPPPPLMRAVSPEFQDWIGPGERTGLGPEGLAHSFDFEISPPEGTASGIYHVDLEANASGSPSGPSIGTGTVIVRVGWEFYPLKPFLMWPIILICLLALAAFLYALAKNQNWSLRHGGRAIKPLKYSRRELAQVALMLAVTALITVGGVQAYQAAPEDMHTWLNESAAEKEPAAESVA